MPGFDSWPCRVILDPSLVSLCVCSSNCLAAAQTRIPTPRPTLTTHMPCIY